MSIGSFFTKKVGPLPVWAYGAIAAGGAYVLMSSGKSKKGEGKGGQSGTDSSDANSATSSGSFTGDLKETINSDQTFGGGGIGFFNGPQMGGVARSSISSTTPRAATTTAVTAMTRTDSRTTDSVAAATTSAASPTTMAITASVAATIGAMVAAVVVAMVTIRTTVDVTVTHSVERTPGVAVEAVVPRVPAGAAAVGEAPGPSSGTLAVSR